MRFISMALLSGAALSLLAGCQTTKNVGTATITSMSEKTIKAYHNYRQTIPDYIQNDMVFVYSEIRGGFAWAGRNKRDGVSHAASKALESCHSLSPDLTCKIFDINGRIVWKGVSNDLLARLNDVPDASNAISQNYGSSPFQISSSQIRSFERYMNSTVKNDHSAFYVSDDGISVGSAFVTGSQSYSLSRNGALKNCLLNSDNRPCYLFAQDGKPVNKNAHNAVYINE